MSAWLRDRIKTPDRFE
jgi:hypothetical protein